MSLLLSFVRPVQGYNFPTVLGRKLLLRRQIASSTVPPQQLVQPSGWTTRKRQQYYRFVQRHPFSSATNSPEIAAVPDEFEQCWRTTSQMVNPNRDPNMDAILQGLNSPAPQSFYILQRAMKEISLAADSASFVENAVQECSYLVKPGWQLVVQKPGLLHHASTAAAAPLQWNLIPLEESTSSKDDSSSDDSIIVTEGSGGPNACQLSTQALNMVSKAADSQQPLDTNALDDLVAAMERRIRFSLGTDIRGRTSADMAFNMCLAGIDNDFLYASLVKVAKLEMERVGQRPSRKSRDVLHVVEKLAASGIKGPEVEEVYQLAAKSLQAKEEYPEVVEQLLSSPFGSLDLLSPRPLLWLWRYSSRLQKPASKESSPARNHMLPWNNKFEDTSKPLVVDIGCGLGVSLLGLASLQQAPSSTASPSSSSSSSSSSSAQQMIPLDWSNCNYLGGDLSEATVRFANTIAHRWDLSTKLRYAQLSAEELLDDVMTHYPGPVSLIMIQFPSPWRLPKKGSGGGGGGGNSQLALGPDDDKFMVSKALMAKIAKVMQSKENNDKKNGDDGCYFLLQTNCEDVALVLRDRAKEFGLTLVPSLDPVLLVASKDDDEQEGHLRIPERTVEWLKLNDGDTERAVGPEWSRTPCLPPKCATETEVACTIQGTPVHRCLFKVE